MERQLILWYEAFLKWYCPLNIQITLGGLITVTGQDGKPVQIAASTLQAQMQKQITPGTEIILFQFFSNYQFS